MKSNKQITYKDYISETTGGYEKHSNDIIFDRVEVKYITYINGIKIKSRKEKIEDILK